MQPTSPFTMRLAGSSSLIYIFIYIYTLFADQVTRTYETIHKKIITYYVNLKNVIIKEGSAII